MYSVLGIRNTWAQCKKTHPCHMYVHCLPLNLFYSTVQEYRSLLAPLLSSWFILQDKCTSAPRSSSTLCTQTGDATNLLLMGDPLHLLSYSSPGRVPCNSPRPVRCRNSTESILPCSRLCTYGHSVWRQRETAACSEITEKNRFAPVLPKHLCYCVHTKPHWRLVSMEMMRSAVSCLVSETVQIHCAVH